LTPEGPGWSAQRLRRFTPWEGPVLVVLGDGRPRGRSGRA